MESHQKPNAMSAIVAPIGETPVTSACDNSSECRKYSQPWMHSVIEPCVHNEKTMAEDIRHELFCTIRLLPICIVSAGAVYLLTMVSVMQSSAIQRRMDILLSITPALFSMLCVITPARGPKAMRWKVTHGIILLSVLAISTLFRASRSPWAVVSVIGGANLFTSFVPFVSYAKYSMIVPLVLALAMATSACVICLYIITTLSFDLGWIAEIMVNGVVFQLFVMFMGKCVISDLFVFTFKSVFSESSSSELMIFFAMTSKQAFQLAGLIAVMNSNTTSSFVISVVMQNVFEIGSIVLNLILLKSERVVQLRVMLFGLSNSIQSTAIEENPAIDVSDGQNFIKQWMDQFQTESKAKLALIGFGEETGDKANVMIAAFTGVVFSIHLHKASDASPYIARALALLVVEFAEDMAEKRIYLNYAGIRLSSIRTPLSGLFGVLAISTYVVGIYLCIWLSLQQT